VQHATTLTPGFPRLQSKLFVDPQQQIKKPGISDQGLVQVNLSFRFSNERRKPLAVGVKPTRGASYKTRPRACGADDDEVSISEGLPRLP
jgi:hypothetical protein